MSRRSSDESRAVILSLCKKSTFTHTLSTKLNKITGTSLLPTKYSSPPSRYVYLRLTGKCHAWLSQAVSFATRISFRSLRKRGKPSRDRCL